MTPDVLLQTVVAGEQMGTLGDHALIFTPTFTDLAEDYQLLAVVDHTDEIEESEEGKRGQAYLFL